MNKEEKFGNFVYRNAGWLGAYIVEKNGECTKQVDVSNIKKYIEELLQENKKLQQKVNQLETSITSKDSELLQLKEELRQLKTNREDAIGYIKYCQTSDKDIFPVIEAEKMIEILERGKEL